MLRDDDSLNEDPDEADCSDSDSADLTVCPSCGRQIYEDADQCPSCGDYLNGDKTGWDRKRIVWAIAAALVILAFLLYTIR